MIQGPPPRSNLIPLDHWPSHSRPRGHLDGLVERRRRTEHVSLRLQHQHLTNPPVLGFPLAPIQAPPCLAAIFHVHGKIRAGSEGSASARSLGQVSVTRVPLVSGHDMLERAATGLWRRRDARVACSHEHAARASPSRPDHRGLPPQHTPRRYTPRRWSLWTCHHPSPMCGGRPAAARCLAPPPPLRQAAFGTRTSPYSADHVTRIGPRERAHVWHRDEPILRVPTKVPPRRPHAHSRQPTRAGLGCGASGCGPLPALPQSC